MTDYLRTWPYESSSLSRVTAIASASTRGGSDANVLAAYYYNGMGRMVIKDLPQPDVRLDYNGGGGNTYVGFDRFGRVQKTGQL